MLFTVPVSPHQLPIADVMKLRPDILRFPRFAIPLNSIVNVSLYELQTALEEQEPGAIWKQLKRK